MQTTIRNKVDGAQTTTGTTDGLGNFNYFPGQVCSFKVGNVTLGNPVSIPSDGKLTPQDVAGVSRLATFTPSSRYRAIFTKLK